MKNITAALAVITALTLPVVGCASHATDTPEPTASAVYPTAADIEWVEYEGVPLG